MPVGHAVMASTCGRPVSTAACASAAAAAASRAALASAAFFSFSACSASWAASAVSITDKNSSTVLAARSASAKSSCMSSIESLASTSRCTLAWPSGAAIMKMRSEGLPSGAFQSTPAGTVMAARPGRTTASVLACGMATPSPTAVLNCDSRSSTAARYFSRSLMVPLASCRSTSTSMASACVAASTPSFTPFLLNNSVIFIANPFPRHKPAQPSIFDGLCRNRFDMGDARIMRASR